MQALKVSLIALIVQAAKLAANLLGGGVMWQQFLRRACFVGLLWIAAACGPSVPFTIYSKKSPEFQQPIHQMYVFFNVGALGDVPREQFEAAIAKTARACNLRLVLEYMSSRGLQLNDEEYAQAQVEKVERRGFQHLLFLHVAGGTKDQYGGRADAIYEASLWDISSDKRLWRARMTIPMHWTSTDTNLGTMLTRALLNQLVSDGAIDPSCHRDAPPESRTSRRRH